MTPSFEKIHTLTEYVALLENAALIEKKPCFLPEDTEIHGLTYDSREVRPGTLFVCKGIHFKEAFLDEAAQKGAVAYVSEKGYASSLPGILVSDLRRALPLLANLFYDQAPRSLTTIGITGTKGKSTTCYFLKTILDDALEKPAAILSTIDNFDGIAREEATLSTPETFELHAHYANARSAGLSHMVLETSSQALKYRRTEGVPFTVACLLNIGEDHISPAEHPDFDDYLSSKLQIFQNAKYALIGSDIINSFIPPASESCLTGDAVFSRALEAASRCGCRVYTFGTRETDDFYSPGALHAPTAQGHDICFEARIGTWQGKVHLPIPGLFNVHNALCALGAASLLGLSVPEAARALSKAVVPGREQAFWSRDGRVGVIVDYAHNSLSFKALFESARDEFPDHELLAVFGCPGSKALTRRRDLGLLAGKYCDLSILTEEDPADETVSGICEEIAGYVHQSGGVYEIIPDRTKAIERAVLQETARPRIVYITGKGTEGYQKRGAVFEKSPSDTENAAHFLAVYDSLHVPANAAAEPSAADFAESKPQ